MTALQMVKSSNYDANVWWEKALFINIYKLSKKTVNDVNGVVSLTSCSLQVGFESRNNDLRKSSCELDSH